jgi:hypothetical protein
MPFAKGNKLGKPFQPGQSGNVTGLPKDVERDIKEEFKAAAALGGMEAVAALRLIVSKAQTDKRYWETAIHDV